MALRRLFDGQVKIPTRGASKNIRVLLAGYRMNGINGLSTIQFCEAQIEYMLANGVSQNAECIDEYRNQIELERGRL